MTKRIHGRRAAFGLTALASIASIALTGFGASALYHQTLERRVARGLAPTTPLRPATQVPTPTQPAPTPTAVATAAPSPTAAPTAPAPAPVAPAPAPVAPTRQAPPVATSSSS